MKTKGTRKREDRRLMRRREKNADIPRDKMAGRACRRSYGDGFPPALDNIKGESDESFTD